MRRFWMIVNVAAVISLLLTACVAAPQPGAQPAAGGEQKAAAPAESGGTLIVGRGGDSVGLDAGTVTDGESARVIGEVIEPLVRQEGKTTKIIPWLAESWETTDSQTWTFHLRQGVKFHDGTPFNAEAVKWNMDRWRDPNNKFRFGRTFEYYDSEFGKDFALDEVTAVDENTLQIKLHQPSAVLLAKLSLGFVFGMNSPKAVEEQGEKYGTAAGTSVGTGPFKFVEWVPDDHITVERNADWWGEGPKLDRIIFRSIPDNSARFAELQAGTVLQADLAQTDTEAAAADPNINLTVSPALRLCTAVALLSSVKVQLPSLSTLKLP